MLTMGEKETTHLELIEEAIRQRDSARAPMELLRCALVIPRRSVDRVRHAIADGRDPEVFLQDIEDGLNYAYDLARKAEEGDSSALGALEADG
jgi:hypothetical protein